jgi:hypothetical protein
MLGHDSGYGIGHATLKRSWRNARYPEPGVPGADRARASNRWSRRSGLWRSSLTTQSYCSRRVVRVLGEPTPTAVVLNLERLDLGAASPASSCFNPSSWPIGGRMQNQSHSTSVSRTEPLLSRTLPASQEHGLTRHFGAWEKRQRLAGSARFNLFFERVRDTVPGP